MTPANIRDTIKLYLKYWEKAVNKEIITPKTALGLSHNLLKKYGENLLTLDLVLPFNGQMLKKTLDA